MLNDCGNLDESVDLLKFNLRKNLAYQMAQLECGKPGKENLTLIPYVVLQNIFMFQQITSLVM